MTELFQGRLRVSCKLEEWVQKKFYSQGPSAIKDDFIVILSSNFCVKIRC
jgi:hypothetical protein